MRFDYSAKNAAFVRQHGHCAKCGKYLNMVYEDRRGYDGAWTAHDLVPLEEGGSSKAHNCVILCITEPDCHLSFAHGGDLHQRVFLTPYAFPGWIYRNGGGQDALEDTSDQIQSPAGETPSSGSSNGVPLSTPPSGMNSRPAAVVHPLTRRAVRS
jgi:hypothetical protein